MDGDDGDDNDNNDGIDDETSQITGVPQTNIEGNSHEDGGINGGSTTNITNIDNSSPEDGYIPSQDEGNTHIMDNDEISIKNGSSEDPQVTINDINIIKEMNTAQIHNNNTNEEAIENNREWTTVASNNRYNLRPRPANRGNMYTLLQKSQ